MPIQYYNYTAIPPQGDPTLDAIVPGVAQGLKLSYMPKQLDADLKSQELKQALRQIQLKYAEPQAQADLNLTKAKAANVPNQQALQALHLQLLQQKLQQGSQYTPRSSMGKLESDYQNAVQQFGKDSTQAQQLMQAINSAAQGKGGVTVFDPKTGTPLVNVGGSNNNGRAGGGGTYVNPQTGEVTSKPTNAQATRAQRGLSGAENLEQFMKSYIEVLPQFQNPIVKGTASIEGALNKYLGQNFDLPSQQAYGKASLNAAAEGLLNDFQLNATNENIQRVTDILSPADGESKEGFEARALKQLQDFIKVKQRNQEKLNKGYSVGDSDLAISPDQITRLGSFLKNSGADTSAMGGNVNAASSALNNVPAALPGAVVAQTPDGQYHQIDKNKLEAAKKKYPELKVVANGQ